MKNDLEQSIKERISVIDNALRSYVHKKNNAQSIIYEAMEYSLFAGGKRLRPILMTEMCRVCGGDTAEVMPFACAMEMIHTYSLIHDDLPAMDNDDLRRGMPTNHIKFGEATAILSGDALLNLAFETVTDYKGSNPAIALRAAHMLAASSGADGMIGGQIIDLESEGKEISIDTLKNLHILKTGAIIRSACTIGALIGGASDDEMRAADEFAVNLGTAFQIRDDILDVIGDEAELGKPIGSDAEQNKNTYVSILGLERSEQLVGEYSAKAKTALNIFGDRAEFLKELTDYLTDRNK